MEVSVGQGSVLFNVSSSCEHNQMQVLKLKISIYLLPDICQLSPYAPHHKTRIFSA